MTQIHSDLHAILIVLVFIEIALFTIAFAISSKRET